MLRLELKLRRILARLEAVEVAVAVALLRRIL
jgi:hypothetical protein